MTRTNLLTFALLSSAATGCTSQNDAPASGPDGLQTLSAAIVARGAPDDAAAVRFVVVAEADDCDGPVVGEQLAEFQAFGLPAERDPVFEGAPFADVHMQLAPGGYRVCATVVDVDGLPVDTCDPGEALAQVQIGLTTEVTVPMACGADQTGGLNAVGVIVSGPTIETLTYDPSKFIEACQAVEVEIGATDPQDDPLIYTFEILEQPAGATPALDVDGSTLRFSTDTPGRYSLMVSVTDESGPPSRQQFPIYVVECGAGEPGPEPNPEPEAPPVPADNPGACPAPDGCADDPRPGAPGEEPLGGRPQVTVRTAELLVGGVRLAGADDPISLIEELADPVRGWDMPAALEGAQRVAVVARLDDDPPLETVLIAQDAASGDLSLTVIDPDADGAVMTWTMTVAGADPVQDAAAADLDGDGRDELVIGMASAVASELRVLDDALTDFAELGRQTFDGATRIRVDAGHLDADFYAEIVAVFEGEAGAAIYVSSLAAELNSLTRNPADEESQGFPLTRAADGGAMENVDVTLGQLRLDGPRSVIFASIADRGIPNQGDYTVAAAEWQGGTLAFLGEQLTVDTRAFADCRAAGSRLDGMMLTTVTAAPGAPALVVMNDQVLGWGEDGLVERGVLDFDAAAELCPGDGRFNSTRADFTFTVSDFDGESGEEIVFAFANSNALIVAGSDGADGLQLLETTVPIEPFEPGSWPLLAAPDLNPEVRVLTYVDHRRVDMDPLVLGVMAAAPCYMAPWQSDDCVTSMGISESIGVSEETTTTLELGLMAGVHWRGTVFDQTKFDLKFHASVSMASSGGWSQTQTLSTEFVGGPFEDTVNYTVLSYDIYNYVITESPDPEEVGAPAVIAVPRTPVRSAATLEFYNAEVAPQLPVASPFVHVIGEPLTYRDQAQAGGLSLDAVLSPPARAPQGGGSIAAGIDFSREETNTRAFGFEAGIEMEAAGGGLLLGFDFSVGVEKSVTSTAGESMSYAGSVGGIEADYAEKIYDFGMVVYPVARADGAEDTPPYHVVDYWVDAP